MKLFIFPLIFTTFSLASAEVKSVADPLCELEQGKTVVWSPLFQATWDKMNQTIGGLPKKMEPPNELAARLDQFNWKAEETFPEDCWKTWAGAGTPQFLATVNKEASAMTGDAQALFNLRGITPDDLALFGLLEREIKFQKPFFESKNEPLIFRNKHRVRFFGTRGKATLEFRHGSRVLAYDAESGSHALEVSCRGDDDTMILYLPDKAQDFATACKQILEWRKEYEDNKSPYGSLTDSRLHKDDDVRIPYITLDTKAEFTDELKGDRYYGHPLDPWKIIRAEQITNFVLSEQGAKVRVRSTLGVQPFGPDPSQMKTIPRKFIYDRPFFILLWREKADWPYLGVWVGDSSAMLEMR